MRRSASLLSTMAAVISVAAVAAAPAFAASPDGGAVVTVDLELEASNGLQAKLETSERKMVTLEIEGKDSQVIYEVKGKVTVGGLKVRFGRLGLIDVAFTPTNTINSTEPSEGCVGEPRTLREGIFTGTIDFTGERGYVRMEGPTAEGSMSVISQWECPEEPTPFAGPPLPLALASKSEKGSASFRASSRGCYCFFDAGVHYGRRGGRSIFYGAKAERREGMGIFRIASATAGVSAFAFDHAAGTATLRPPRPFRGRAIFRDRPHGRDLWRSTIWAPLLGAGLLRTGGPDFRVALYPEYHFD